MSGSFDRVRRRAGGARWALACGLAAGLVGCANPERTASAPPPSDASLGPDTGAEPAFFEFRVDQARRIRAEPPAGIDAKAVRPLQGDALRRARTPLSEIQEELPLPESLRGGGDLGDAEKPMPGGDSSAPSLQVQRLFAAALQQGLEGQGSQAVRLLEAAVRQRPNDPVLLRRLALGWASVGNRVRAAGYFRQAVAADPNDLESVVALGRLLIESGEGEPGTAALLYALRDVGSLGAIDPALPSLARFYASAGLRTIGYTQASADLLDGFLEGPPPRGLRPSRYGAELAFLLRRRAVHEVARGDLRARLGEFVEARLAYERARRGGASGQDLARRMVYADLWLGRIEEATREVLDAVRAQPTSPMALGMIEYLVGQGVPAAPIVAGLRALPTDEQDPDAAALALASALPREAAVDLLGETLDARPAADRTFDKWLALVMRPPAEADAPQRVLLRTAAAIEADPARAARFAGALLAGATDLDALRDAFARLAEPVRKTPAMLTLEAVVAFERGDLETAEARLDAALASPVPPTLAQTEKARLLALRGDFAEAQSLLDRVGSDTTDARLGQLRVGVLVELGRIDEALILLDALIAERPGDPRFAISKARLLVKEQRAPDAERALLDALAANPRGEVIYAELLRLYDRNAGDLPNFEQSFQRLVRRMLVTIPNSRIARLTNAGILEVQGETQRAERLLNGLLRDNPDDRDALLILLEVYTKTDRVPQAEAIIERLLEAQPRNREVLESAMRFYTQRGDQDRRLMIRERVLRLSDPGFGRDLQLAVLLRRQPDRLDEVLELLDAAARRPEAQADGAEQLEAVTLALISEQPDDVVAVRRADFERRVQAVGPSFRRDLLLARLIASDPERLGEAAVVLEDLAEQAKQERNGLIQWAAVVLQTMRTAPLEHAEAALRAVVDEVDLDPPFRRAAAYTLATAYEAAGRPDGTDALFEALLEAMPGDAELNNHVGYVWAYAGRRLEQAEALIADALEADKDQSAYLDSMGWVRYKRGDLAGAELWLRRAAAAPGGDNPVILDHLGDVLYRLGRSDEAKAMWTRAREGMNDPENQGTGDPETDTVLERTTAKLSALAADGDVEVPVAPFGSGVEAVHAAPAGPAETP
ncbi:MAG: tetratricopeptide repeat protein [Planctomycetota bacterium]